MTKVATGAKLTIGNYWELARDTVAEIGVLLLQAEGRRGCAADYDSLAAIIAPRGGGDVPNYVRKSFAGAVVRKTHN